MSNFRWWGLAGWCAALALVGGGHSAQAQAPVRAIITFRPDVDRNEAYTEAAVRGVGARPMQHLHLAHGLVANLTPAQALALRRRSDVEYVEPDQVAHATGYPVAALAPQASGPQVSAQAVNTQQITWGISAVKAPAAWPLDAGYAIKVGVLDSGINLRHPDLAGNIHGGVNVITYGQDAGVSFDDDCGHGSHVAGIIAAENNSFGVVGVAPKAWLYAIKALDSTGAGYTSDLIAGVDWAVNNGMQVVNMSLGMGQSSYSFQQAVNAATAAGVVLVAAAGNTSGATEYPAAYTSVNSVSCVNQYSGLAWFSSVGKVDVCAPGVNIRSCWLSGPPGGGYMTEQGTSMSCAFVTGVVALFLRKHPAATPTQVMADLKTEATPIGNKAYYGAGEINAYLAALGPITRG